ncbi:MAG: hypothetical protein AB7H80_17375 [Candidatus Kapaibacterium sp.]
MNKVSKMIVMLGGILVALPCLFSSLNAQSSSKLLLLPAKTYDVEESSARTLTALLRKELDRRGKYTVVSESNTPDNACQDVECAVGEGKNVGASRVVYSDFSKLGSKIVWSYTVVDVKDNRKILSTSVTRSRIEDFQSVIGEMAESVETGSADISSESSRVIVSTRNTTKRDTLVVGVGFGQLFPVHGYVIDSGLEPDTVRREFVLDIRANYQLSDYTLDLLFGIRHGVAINIGGSYDPFRSFISPYVGAGFGYHFLIDEEIFENNDPDFYSSGFLAMIRGGFWILKNSPIRAYVNLDYMYTLNTRSDQAVTFTFGLAAITDTFGF